MARRVASKGCASNGTRSVRAARAVCRRGLPSTVLQLDGPTARRSYSSVVRGLQGKPLANGRCAGGTSEGEPAIVVVRFGIVQAKSERPTMRHQEAPTGTDDDALEFALSSDQRYRAGVGGGVE